VDRRHISKYSYQVPVNGSKSVEVVHHDAVDVPEAVKFPKAVKAGHAALPEPRDLTEGPYGGAAVCARRLSDRGHTAAVADPGLCQSFEPGQRLYHGTAPYSPPSHHSICVSPLQLSLLLCLSARDIWMTAEVDLDMHPLPTLSELMTCLLCWGY